MLTVTKIALMGLLVGGVGVTYFWIIDKFEEIEAQNTKLSKQIEALAKQIKNLKGEKNIAGVAQW